MYQQLMVNRLLKLINQKLNNKDKDCQTQPQRNLSARPKLRPNQPKNSFGAKPDEKKQENRSELEEMFARNKSRK